MAEESGAAPIVNASLAAFARLVGEWETIGHHPMVPGVTFHGHVSFTWTEGGAFLMMRSETAEHEIPNGIAIFAGDDSTGDVLMLYFDVRGVARRYATSLQDGVWRWWRDAADFSQRFEGTFGPDGRTIVSRGEMSREGAPWEADLQLTYTRV